MTTYTRRPDPSPLPTSAGEDAQLVATYLQALLKQTPATELPHISLRLARTDAGNVPGIAVEDAVNAVGKVVVLGKAGSGKTTMLSSVVSSVAVRSLEAHFGRPDGDRSLSLEDQRIPLFVALADTEGLHLPELLQRSFTNAGVRVSAACTERLVEDYPLLIAYDGLDEVRAERRLEAAAEIASTVTRAGSPHRFLVSCREDEFSLYSVWFDECETRHIEPVTQEQAREYLTATVQRADSQWRLRDERVWGFVSTVRALDCLRQELTDNKGPAGSAGKLLLGVGRKLLLQAEAKRRARGGDAVQSRTMVRLLAALAFSMRAEGVAKISREQACSVIAAALGDELTPEPHLELLLDSGLIESTDARRCLQFLDTAIEETFSAYALLLHVESGGSLNEYVAAEADRERWSAPLTLLYGLHPDRGAMLRAVMGDGRNPALVRLAVRCLVANEPVDEWGQITAQSDLDTSAHLYLGTAFAELGHHDQAILELGRAIQGGLDSAEVHARLGSLNQTRGDHAAARLEFEQALEREPANTAYKRHLGMCLALDGQYELAIACLREVIADLKGDCALTQHELGGIYKQQGRTTDATAELQEAADLVPGSALYRTSLGAVLAASGDLNAAATQLHAALEHDPEFAAAHNELGAVLEQQGRLEEALVQYSRAADLHPGEPVYHRNAGTVLRMLGRTAGAERELTTAIELDASYADAYNELGILMLETGRPAAALENFQRAVELVPAQAQYHLRTGIAYRALKQPAEAIRALETAASIEPTADTHGVLADAYSADGHLLEAVQQYRWAVELSGGLPSYLVNAAQVQRRAGLLAEAEASLQRALAADSSLAGAHFELGVLLEDQGRIQDAFASYARASELAPDVTEYLVALSRSARMAGDTERARAVIDRAVELAPSSGAVWDEMGTLALERGDTSLALQHSRTAVAREPENARYRTHLARALRQGGAISQALDSATEAARLDPQLPAAQHEYALALAATGDLDAALGRLRTATRLEPQDPTYALDLGRHARLRGRLNEALNALHRAVELDPHSGPAHMELGLALGDTGRWNEALGHLRSALLTDDGDAQYRHHYGVACLRTGNVEAAVTNLLTAVEQQPANAGAQADLAEALAAAQRPGDALTALRAASASEPENPAYLVRLATLLREQGEYRAAQETLDRALELNPNSAAARSELGLVLSAQGLDERGLAQQIRAVKVEPDNGLYHFRLGAAYLRQRAHAQAVEELELALRIEPGHAEWQHELGRALSGLARREDALQPISKPRPSSRMSARTTAMPA